MIRFVTAFIAATLALAAPANAYEVGEVFKFTESSIGCFKAGHAGMAATLKESNGQRAAIEFAFKVQEDGLKVLRETGRQPTEFCDLISQASAFQYQIVEVGEETKHGGGSVLVCVRPVIVGASAPTTAFPCSWHVLPKKAK